MVHATQQPSISVLLATYNWPQALNLCLQSLQAQTQAGFEVVIADDGSRADTADLIAQYVRIANFPIVHVWQEDLGFRKALALNKALEKAQGDYLVFLDGDCLAQPDFVARHRQLAQAGHMVTGSRVLMSPALTAATLASASGEVVDGHSWAYAEFSRRLAWQRLQGGVNKALPFLFKLPDNPLRLYRKFVWRRIKGCNMACWKQDALAIGGFDTFLIGWGHEDADFVFRLQQAGLVRKSGAWSTEVLHLFHPEGDQSRAAENAARVREKIKNRSSKVS